MICSHGVSCSSFDTYHLYNSFKFKDVMILFTDEESEALLDYVNHRGCLYKTSNEILKVLNFQVCAVFTGYLCYGKCPLTVQAMWINI